MIITCPLLACVEDVRYLRQNLPSCAVCLFRAQAGARGASRVTLCKSHLQWCQGKWHSSWRNVVKKVISKTLPTFFGASGRQYFRNMATTGCGDSLECQPKQGLSSHSVPCLKSEVSSCTHEHMLGAVGMWDIVSLSSMCGLNDQISFLL